MAYASRIPVQVADFLRKLKEKYPEYHWTFSRNIAMADGYTLTLSNDEIINSIDFVAGVPVMRMADKLVKETQKEAK